MINRSIFREYDIRGLAERDFSGEALGMLARGLAEWYRRQGASHLIMAHDCRVHSPRILNDIAAVLLSEGFDLTVLGHCSTPCFYHACYHLDADGGMMITASHNPPQDNGLKLMLGRSTLFGEQIQQIRQIIEDSHFGHESAATTTVGKIVELDYVPRYIEDLIGKIELGPRRLKVVVDNGNGSTGPIVARLMERYSDRIELIPLHFEPDGTFPNHEADPVKPKNLVELRQRVVAERADLGVAFDGDGDRIGVVDEQAEIIWGDMLMILFWREIMPRHPGAIGLVEVKCSQVLFDEIARLGGRPEFCRTGHSLIKARMRETEAVFTGELSGHIFFADEYYGFDDALYTFLRLLRLLTQSDRRVSQLLSDLPKVYNTPETRIPSSDEEKFDVVAKLSEVLAADWQVVTVDGVRVVFPEGWGLFRASNTQPAIVARCEATSAEKLTEYKQLLDEAYGCICVGEHIVWEH